jgi:hypothetical protein
MRRLVWDEGKVVGATAWTQDFIMKLSYGSINSHKLLQVIWPHNSELRSGLYVKWPEEPLLSSTFAHISPSGSSTDL